LLFCFDGVWHCLWRMDFCSSRINGGYRVH